MSAFNAVALNSGVIIINMSPLSVELNGEHRHTIGRNGGSFSEKGYAVTYFGDEYGGYGVKEGDRPVVSGTMSYRGQVASCIVDREVFPPIEKGEPPTVVGKTLTLRRI